MATGGDSHKFVEGPCVVTTNFAHSKHDIYVRGDDAKINRMEYVSSGTRS